VNNDSGPSRFAFHIPPESDFSISRNPYSPFPGTLIHMPRIPQQHARQAAEWCEYLESHARRIYSGIVTPQLRAAQELAGKIKSRKVGADGFFSCRGVYLKGWSGLDSPEAVKLAVEILKDAGWIRPVGSEPGPSGGRPSDRYAVNPRVWE
jgi:hypothetical protein